MSRAFPRLQALLVVAEPVPPRVDAAIADEALWIVARRHEGVRRHLCRIAKAAVTHEAIVGETTRSHYQGAARRQNTSRLSAGHVWGRRTLLRARHHRRAYDAQDGKDERVFQHKIIEAFAARFELCSFNPAPSTWIRWLRPGENLHIGATAASGAGAAACSVLTPCSTRARAAGR
jgi:hypothetical protein